MSGIKHRDGIRWTDSIRFRLSWMVLASTLALMAVMLALSGMIVRNAVRERTEDAITGIATLLGYSVTAGLDFDSPSSVREALSGVFRIEDVGFAMVTKPNGSIYQKLGDAPDAKSLNLSPDRLEFTVVEGNLVAHMPVYDTSNTLLGILHVGYAEEAMHAALRKHLVILILVGGSLILLGLLVAGHLGTRLTKPILALADATAEIAEGHFGKPVPIRRTDEVGVVAGAFNEMSNRLQDLLNRIERHKQELETKVVERTAELRRKNLELAAQNEKVMETSRLKSAFLANMSHELRTPLNAILALSELMKDEVLGPMANEEQRRQVEMIYNSGENLLRLINEVLDLSKIESGKFEIQYEEADIQETLRKAAEQTESLARAKGIDFRATFIGTGRGWADEDRVRQVFLNLVGNAIKFTEKGSVEILSHLEADAERLTVQVRDTGIGIDRKDQEKIFQEFQQVDGSVRRKFGGTGLGLAICRRLLNLMAGSIRVDSQRGRGSTFTFDVPVYREKPERIEGDGLGDDPLVGEPSVLHASTPIHAETSMTGSDADATTLALAAGNLTTGAAGCVLLVDDDEIILETLVRYLTNEGMSCQVARNGVEALAEMDRNRPDVMVLDLMMPGMSGFEVIDTLRRADNPPAVPVLVYTAKDLNEAEWEGLRQSVVRILRKGRTGVRLLVEDIRQVIDEHHQGEKAA